MDTELFDTFTSFKPASRKHRITDDDFVDRLNRYITPIIICSFSILICAKQYVVGEPIQCWTPQEFSEAWEDYTENYCWVQNTYFVSPTESLPKQHLRQKLEISYYQWVPFVLAIQAGLFALPFLFWKSLNGSSGMDIKSFVRMSIEASDVDPKTRNANIRMIARHVKLSLTQNLDNQVPKRRRTNSRATIKGRSSLLCKLQIFRGKFVSCLYIFVKFLYIVNIAMQFLLLQVFLGTDYNFYGIQILIDLFKGRDWQISGHFPRVTMCDFEVRNLGQPRKYSVQCVLVINLFNEKVYIFIWFWIVLMAILTIVSIISWLAWFLIPSWKNSTILKYLKRLDYGNRKEPGYISYDGSSYLIKEGERLVSHENQWHKDEFIENILRTDGLFLMRMIANNVGEPIVFDIVNALWLDITGKKSLDEIEDKPAKLNDRDPPKSPALTLDGKSSGFDLGGEDEQNSSVI